LVRRRAAGGEVFGEREAEAFRRLQRRASAQRKSVREVAEAVREADRFYRELETDHT
jgi:hypothetical protein